MTYSPSRPDRPWYSYSSRNRKGKRPDPVVNNRKNLILNLYWQKHEIKDIAEQACISEATVWDYIRRARKAGDPRAANRSHSRQSEKRLLVAEIRRREILELSAQGLSVHMIARRLGCNISLVRKRLREAEQAQSSSADGVAEGQS